MNNPTDGAVIAPVTRTVERKGSTSAPMSRMYPQIRAGTCEFCGTLDPNVPGQYQYKLCPHWRGLELQCTYCDATKNPDDVIGKSTLNVYDHPTTGELIVVCNAYECTRAHQQRFTLNKSVS